MFFTLIYRWLKTKDDRPVPPSFPSVQGRHPTWLLGALSARQGRIFSLSRSLPKSLKLGDFFLAGVHRDDVLDLDL